MSSPTIRQLWNSGTSSAKFLQLDTDRRVTHGSNQYVILDDPTMIQMVERLPQSVRTSPGEYSLGIEKGSRGYNGLIVKFAEGVEDFRGRVENACPLEVELDMIHSTKVHRGATFGAKYLPTFRLITTNYSVSPLYHAYVTTQERCLDIIPSRAFGTEGFLYVRGEEVKAFIAAKEILL